MTETDKYILRFLRRYTVEQLMAMESIEVIENGQSVSKSALAFKYELELKAKHEGISLDEESGDDFLAGVCPYDGSTTPCESCD